MWQSPNTVIYDWPISSTDFWQSTCDFTTLLWECCVAFLFAQLIIINDGCLICTILQYTFEILKASSKLHYPPLSYGQSLDLATSIEPGKNFKSSLSSRRVAISMQRQADIRLGQRDAEVPGLCWRDPTRRRNEGEAPDGKRWPWSEGIHLRFQARTSSMSTESRSRRVDWCSRRTLEILQKSCWYLRIDG